MERKRVITIKNCPYVICGRVSQTNKKITTDVSLNFKKDFKALSVHATYKLITNTSLLLSLAFLHNATISANP